MKYPDPLKVCDLSKNCIHVDGYLCNPNDCLSIVVDKLKKWLGDDGITFFKEMKEKHGKVDAVFMEDGIPYSVHFNEGTQVRNFLRTVPECEEWSTHDFDNKWVNLVNFCITEGN